MKKTTTAFVVLAALGTLTSLASAADTVDMKFTGTGKGQSLKITFNASDSTVFVGQLNHSITAGAGLGTQFIGSHTTFCTDLYEYVTSSTKTYSVVSLMSVPDNAPMGAAKAAAVTNVYQAYGAAAAAGGASNDLAAAFQLAVWEIVTDFNSGTGLASLSMTAGNFKAKNTNNTALGSGITNYLTAMFGVAVNGYNGPTTLALFGLTHKDYQDQIITKCIPTPGAAGVLALGGLSLARRRRA